MQGNVSNAQTISIYNTPDPAADLETGMQLLLHEFGSNNQPTVVTKALPRPVTVVSLEFELAQELADRSSLDKQVQELTAELTVKDTCIIAKADALNVERHYYGLPIKPRNDAGYGIDSFNLSTIGANSTAGQNAPSSALTSASSQHKIRGNMLFDSM